MTSLTNKLIFAGSILALGVYGYYTMIKRKSSVIHPRNQNVEKSVDKGEKSVVSVRSEKEMSWVDPSLLEGAYVTGLKVYNSLTKKKDLFAPQGGKVIKWYICGPTVYDSSHMGHARNYVSFDVIRRILEEYFGYTIFAVMNITDIDDKIILQARKNYFFEQYAEENGVVTEVVINDVVEAYELELEGLKKKIGKEQEKLQVLLKEIGDDAANAKLLEYRSSISLLEEKIEYAENGLLTVKGAQTGSDAYSILQDAKSQLSVLLDDKLGKQFDPDLLRDLVRDHSLRYEDEFMKDMKNLDVRPPDVLTRVSEYVDEIIEMTQTIISNGYGYESNRSVYFDTATFHNHKNHFYAKLEPKSKGDIELQEESEGKLTDLNAVKSEKKHSNDFALWKASKPGEPTWDSPWGVGRPGWHIECSAMAGAIFGDNMDMHSGGEDLRFPHHDNEMAQSEAYFDNKQWVNYFLHSGHLHIDGLKMSKSLKNFVTIGEILDSYTPKQIRLLYLLQAWDRVMNYERSNPMGEVDAWLHTFSNFFLRIENALAASSGSGPQFWRPQDIELNNQYLSIKIEVDDALKDNFDTPKALRSLKKLIKATNSYINKNEERRTFILNSIAKFITKILKVFGLVDDASIGLKESSGYGNTKELLRPYLDISTKFRTAARKIILDNQDPHQLLTESDTLKSELLSLGVELDEEGQYNFTDE